MNEIFEIKTAIDGYARAAENGFKQLTEQVAKTAERVSGVEAQVNHMEPRVYRMASYDGGDSREIGDFGGEARTLGGGLVRNDGFADFLNRGARGHFKYAFEHKTISSLSADVGGAAVAPDHRRNVVLGAQIRLTVRDLLTQARTTSNMVQVPRELLFTNNAATVAELGLKPTSDLTFDLLEVPVRTIAHVMAASRQILDDAPQLRDTVDTKLRYGLGIEEERQLLLGAGTGTDILGLMPQATAYNTAANVAGDNETDTIRRAISQVETTSQLPVDAIIVNSTDWSDMLGLKDTNGGYLSGGPFGTTRPSLWGRPVVDSPSMPSGQFLVGNFRQSSTLYDRMTIEVLLSSEHADFFARNMILIRAESRIALAVTRPWSLCKGAFA